MKKLLAALCAAGLAVSPALAGDDFEAYCEGYMEENDGDASGCACLAEASDEDMVKELMEVSSDADLEGLSDASKEAIASCWPDAA